jgi:PAS domain S-box-containing protein
LGRPKVEKKIVVIVLMSSVFFLVAGAALCLWYIREMREIIAQQFNEQQLAVAHGIGRSIERQIGFLQKELLILSKDISDKPFTSEATGESIQESLSHVHGSGVFKIAIADLKTRQEYTYTRHGRWASNELPNELSKTLPPLKDSNGSEDIWTSQPIIDPSKISMFLATYLSSDSSKVVLFQLNLSWLLSPLMKDIRSGKTGYAWLIDDKGNFLYHPVVEFTGRNSFNVRKEKQPGISYSRINSIQEQEMMKGREGTDWYVTGWHRGNAGEVKKLIAYCPAVVSENPPQRWSVAVVAPMSEIEGAVLKGATIQFLLQGLVIIVVLCGALAVLFFEVRWSRLLEVRVKQRTEDLARSEEKYRSLVESAEEFIFTVDPDGNIQSMNSFTANVFGGRPEDFIGKRFLDVFPEKPLADRLKLVRLVYYHGRSVRDEFELRLGDRQIWLSASFMPLWDGKGKVDGVLCIARDVTESKNLQRQLINAEKLASLGTLAAGVAHEVNNPLGIMLGFCDILLRKSDRSSQDFEDLKTIERQGLHCKVVVENLLSFARLDKEATEYSDLNSCIEDILKIVAHTLDMKKVKLISTFVENIPPIKGDFRQIKQVLLNLINNAIAAMPDGGNLTICTFAEKLKQKAVITITDDGIGIKDEDMEHIYEPFFTTKPEGEGTGLGLFVSYGIINKFGGSIDCVSSRADSPGKSHGTTFTIALITKDGGI